MAQLNTTKAKLVALAGAAVAALMSGDVSGYSPDLAAIMRDSPIVLGIVLYVELRILPWMSPLRRYAQRELGELPAFTADAPEDLIETSPVPRITNASRASGPVKS